MSGHASDRVGVPFSPPVIDSRDAEAVQRVLASGWLTSGDECLALERELAELVGAPYVVSVSSCTAALEIAYASLGLPRGARVGVPTWTFVSSALAVAHQGGRPVLLDIDPITLNVSPGAVAAAVVDGLDALVVVHFAGNPVDESIYEMCRQRGVPVIEDAAHALGAVDARGSIAGRGTVGAAYSFYATKNLTAGEGGALATQSEELANFARSFRLHGLSHDAWDRYRPGVLPTGYDLVAPGIKANLSDLHAALCRSQLTRFAEFQERRRQLVERYRLRLADHPGLRPVGPSLVPGGADHLMVVLLPDSADRSSVRARLAEHGIATSVHFRPLHEFGWFQEHAATGPTGVEAATASASSALSLPLSPALTIAQVDQVCDELFAAVGE